MNNKSPRNKTISLSEEDIELFSSGCIKNVDCDLDIDTIRNKTIIGDFFNVTQYLPKKFADLVIVDPPYNLSKEFDNVKFNRMNDEEYFNFTERWVKSVVGNILKDNGSLYVCCDWKSSSIIHQALSKYINVINRITWKRDKGRGAAKNWKNNLEDIYFCVKNKQDYYFDLESVKVKKKVIAPYRENGKPKDWIETDEGKFRMTCPSNLWEDIVIPFWSMPENTDHPTQKPEKLIERLVLASCPERGFVFDPFLGSGTTSVIAKKMNRDYCGIELSPKYAATTEFRLKS